MVDDDLPAFFGFFEDEGEDAVGVTAFFFASFEVVFADADGEFFVEGVDFELGEAEGSHGGFGGVVVVVLVDHAGEASVELAGDEDGVGGVFVALGEAVDVAAVPGGLLLEEDLDDVEFLLGGGVEGLGLGVEGWGGEAGEEGEDDEVTAKGDQHGRTSGNESIVERKWDQVWI